MRILKVFILILALASARFADAAAMCSELFEHSPSRRMAKPLIDKMSWQDWKVRLFETRISKPDANGQVEVVRKSLYRTAMTEGRHESTAIYFSKKKGTQTNTFARDATVMRKGKSEFNRIRQKAMDFVIASYLQRRPHWPEKFRKKLMRLSKEYEKESTYILVENRAWDDLHNSHGEQKDSELIGTIRLIHEKNGKLPMEDYLNLKIKTSPNQLKVEPGNFAMLHEGNEISSVEFAIQILAQMKRYREEFGKEPFFVTYADSFSEKLYGGMGFQYLEAHQVESSPTQDNNGKKGLRIIVGEDGEQVTWAPMFATEEMLTKHLEDRLLRSALKREDAALLQNFISAIDQTGKAVTHDPTVFVGFEKDRAAQTRNDISRLFVFREVNSTKLYLQHGYEYERDVFRSGEWINLPSHLHEGWTAENSLGKMSYQNGVLSLTEQQIHEGSRYYTTTEIAIDEDLTAPQWARVVSNLSGYQKDYEVIF